MGYFYLLSPTRYKFLYNNSPLPIALKLSPVTLVYLNLAYRNDILINGKAHYGYISLIFGNVYYKNYNYQSALKFYLQGISLIESQKVYKDLIEGYNGIAKAYTPTGQADSSILYLQKTVILGRKTPFLLGMLDASTMLDNIHKSRSAPDSTIKYMQLSLSLWDTLYNQEKTRAFQTLVFKEKLREQELEELKAKAKEKHPSKCRNSPYRCLYPFIFYCRIFNKPLKVKKV